MNVMLKLIGLFVVGIVGLTALDKIEVDKLNIFGRSMDPPFTSACTKDTCHIYLSTNIGMPEDYSNLIAGLDLARKGDKFIFHIAGNGGTVKGTMAIIRAIQRTKATVVGIVEGPAYSGHGYIALAMPKLRATDPSFVMIHTTSAFGEMQKVCESRKGRKDRGQDAYIKCVTQYRLAIWYTSSNIVKLMKHIFSKNELKAILIGHDLYITSDELNLRLKAAGRYYNE